MTPTHFVMLIPVEEAIEYISYPKHPTLQELQGLVEGNIEICHSHQIKNGTVLVNEEGLIHSLPYNDIASQFVGRPLVGPVVYCLFDLE